MKSKVDSKKAFDHMVAAAVNGMTIEAAAQIYADENGHKAHEVENAWYKVREQKIAAGVKVPNFERSENHCRYKSLDDEHIYNEVHPLIGRKKDGKMTQAAAIEVYQKKFADILPPGVTRSTLVRRYAKFVRAKKAHAARLDAIVKTPEVTLATLLEGARSICQQLLGAVAKIEKQEASQQELEELKRENVELRQSRENILNMLLKEIANTAEKKPEPKTYVFGKDGVVLTPRDFHPIGAV